MEGGMCPGAETLLILLLLPTGALVPPPWKERGPLSPLDGLRCPHHGPRPQLKPNNPG